MYLLLELKTLHGKCTDAFLARVCGEKKVGRGYSSVTLAVSILSMQLFIKASKENIIK